MDCNYRILHSNDSGYITQCKGCEKIQIAFGTMLIQISELEFLHFKSFILTEIEKYSGYNHPSEKAFIYTTDSSKVRLIFSLIELRELNDLLIQSYLMLEVVKLNI